MDRCLEFDLAEVQIMTTTNLRDGMAYIQLVLGIVVLSAAFVFAMSPTNQGISSNSTVVRVQEHWFITTGGEINPEEPFDLQSDCEIARLAKINFATDQWQMAHDNYRDINYPTISNNIMGPIIKQTMDGLLYKLKLAKSAYCSRHYSYRAERRAATPSSNERSPVS